MQNFTTKPAVAIQRHSVHIPAGRVKLNAAEYADLVSLQDAWDQAQARIDQAQQEASQLREQYRLEGLELGRADAQKETLEQIAKMQHSMNDWVKTTDSQLIELVNRCVAEVVNQIDPSLLSKQAVEKGLSELVSAPHIHVRVKTISADFSETVDELIKRYGIVGNVRIIEDGTLADGDVIVESPVGIVDLRLNKQLQAIGKALKA